MPPSSSTPHAASTHRTALLVIDTQLGLNTATTTYYGTSRSNPSFEHNLTRLLAGVRAYNASTSTTTPIPIIHVHHHSTDPQSPLHPSKPSSGPQACAAPAADEPVLTKSANSAFVGTDLETRLRDLQITQLLVVGIATDRCVSTTTRMAADLQVCCEPGDPAGEAGNAGGEEGERRGKSTRQGVWLVEDCTACFDNGGSVDVEVVQRVHVESLKGEFCDVTDVEGVLEGVLR